jgi:CubicO group peptidase (beta-lactamase class C family)
MKTFQQYLLAFCLVTTAGCAAAQSQQSFDSDLVQAIAAFIRTETESGFSGAVIVQHHGKLLLDKAYGSLQGVTMTPVMRFWIASLGKQFTSAAILKCQEKGWLTIDDPISRFIPAAPEDKRAITIKQLLAHVSSLSANGVSETAKNRDEAIKSILNEPLADRPGVRFIYSSDNYQLAAALIEIVSGKSYEEFVRTELFELVGMRDTGQVIAGRDPTVAPTIQTIPARLLQRRWGQMGYYSTTRDLLKWCIALRTGAVLSQESVKQLFSPVAPIQEGFAALGWFIAKTDRGVRRIFSRGNEGFGANGLIYIYPDTDTAIIVLTHAGNNNDNISYSRAVQAKIEQILFP